MNVTVLLSCQSSRRAYELFRTVNMPGMPLTAADMIKGRLFETLTRRDSRASERVQQAWNDGLARTHESEDVLRRGGTRGGGEWAWDPRDVSVIDASFVLMRRMSDPVRVCGAQGRARGRGTDAIGARAAGRSS